MDLNVLQRRRLYEGEVFNLIVDDGGAILSTDRLLRKSDFHRTMKEGRDGHA